MITTNKQPVSYLQTDKQWKNISYAIKGENSTIGDSGCGPASAAMIIKTLTGKKFTPVTACKWALDHGYKALNQGTYYSYFIPQFAEFEIECKRLNNSNIFNQPNNEVHNTAFSLLKEGWYLIALMGAYSKEKRGNWTGSGHYIVVWWEDGKVRINDPNSTKDGRINGDLLTFKTEVKYYWAVDARKYNISDNISNTNKEEDDDMSPDQFDKLFEEKYNKINPLYHTIAEVPDCWKVHTEKLIRMGKIKGDVAGPIPSDITKVNINIRHDSLRAIIVAIM